MTHPFLYNLLLSQRSPRKSNAKGAKLQKRPQIRGILKIPRIADIGLIWNTNQAFGRTAVRPYKKHDDGLWRDCGMDLLRVNCGGRQTAGTRSYKIFSACSA